MTLKSGTVLILDDDACVRRAYARTLAGEGYSTLEFPDFASLQQSLSAGFFDAKRVCLLLDMRMETNGLVVQRWLTECHSELPVIFVSGESEVAEAISALKAGAVEFLLKPVESEQLIAAVAAALSPREVNVQQPVMPAGFERLSAREAQVLELVVQGMRSQAIADNLGITLRTVKMHRGNIMAKVGVKNVAQLVSFYQQQRFQTPGPSRRASAW
jgi:FixJ family two-component response regulator